MKTDELAETKMKHQMQLSSIESRQLMESEGLKTPIGFSVRFFNRMETNEQLILTSSLQLMKPNELKLIVSTVLLHTFATIPSVGWKPMLTGISGLLPFAKLFLNRWESDEVSFVCQSIELVSGRRITTCSFFNDSCGSYFTGWTKNSKLWTHVIQINSSWIVSL